MTTRIALITPYPPTPPWGGGRTRQFELLRWLAARCELTLATVVFSTADEDKLKQLCPAHVRVLSAKPRRARLNPRLPLALQWSWSEELAELIATEHRARPFDGAVVSHSYAFGYTDSLGDIPRVIDAHNVESRLYYQFSALSRPERVLDRRLAGRAGLGFMGARRTAEAIDAIEKRVWKQADAVLCVSRQERRHIADVVGDRRALHSPNCPTQTGGSSDVPVASSSPARGRPCVCFASSLDYMPNIDAVTMLAEHIAPLTKKEAPNMRIVVAGRQPSRRLVRYCRAASIEVVADPPDMGAVTRGCVFACPVRLGAGTRLKILDARSAGLPVVTTSMGAEGLDIAGDPHVAVRDGWDGFSRALLAFMDERSPETRTNKGSSWDDSFSPLSSVLTDL